MLPASRGAEGAGTGGARGRRAVGAVVRGVRRAVVARRDAPRGLDVEDVVPNDLPVVQLHRGWPDLNQRAVHHLELLPVRHLHHLPVDHLHDRPIGHLNYAAIRVRELEELAVRELHH